MASEDRISTRCPACRTRYRVPASAADRRVTCRECGLVFRVVEHTSHGHPTEDDILRWLNEGMEDFDFPGRARAIARRSMVDEAMPQSPDKPGEGRTSASDDAPLSSKA